MRDLFLYYDLIIHYYYNRSQQERRRKRNLSGLFAKMSSSQLGNSFAIFFFWGLISIFPIFLLLLILKYSLREVPLKSMQYNF